LVGRGGWIEFGAACVAILSCVAADFLFFSSPGAPAAFSGGDTGASIWMMVTAGSALLIANSLRIAALVVPSAMVLGLVASKAGVNMSKRPFAWKRFLIWLLVLFSVPLAFAFAVYYAGIHLSGDLVK
jgi:hypothetical protein